jgi:deoxyadenosine/deoxycytidine kinase
MSIVSLEGNIGAGKSTLLESLRKEFEKESDIVFVSEPVDVWEKFKDKSTGQTVLEKFYADPSKYAFAFQIMAFTTRLQVLQKTIEENPQAKLFICERSLDADKHIFAKMLNDDGTIDNIMYQIYECCFQEYLVQIKSLDLSGIIHVNTDPTTCYNRIKTRGREGEDKININYLQRCDLYHKRWFENIEIPVLNISSDYNTENKKILNKFLKIDRS